MQTASVLLFGLAASTVGLGVLLISVFLILMSEPDLWFNDTVAAVESEGKGAWGRPVDLSERFGAAARETDVLAALAADGFAHGSNGVEPYRRRRLKRLLDRRKRNSDRTEFDLRFTPSAGADVFSRDVGLFLCASQILVFVSFEDGRMMEATGTKIGLRCL